MEVPAAWQRAKLWGASRPVGAARPRCAPHLPSPPPPLTCNVYANVSFPPLPPRLPRQSLICAFASPRLRASALVGPAAPTSPPRCASTAPTPELPRPLGHEHKTHGQDRVLHGPRGRHVGAVPDTAQDRGAGRGPQGCARPRDRVRQIQGPLSA